MQIKQLPVPLSILDATVVGPGVSPPQAVAWTQAVAQMADIRGFHRLWVVEHHGVPDIGCARPAVMMAHLAAVTQRIRIGSGGIMLPNHAPLAVAEEFALLSALHPGRIDLGIGRAGGQDEGTNSALGRKPDSQQAFEAQLDELFDFLGTGFPPDHPYAKVSYPLKGIAPPTFLLGSSVASAAIAAKRALPYSFAHHLNPQDTVRALAAYRDQFCASHQSAVPHAIITTAVICAATQAEAEASAYRTLIPKIRRGVAMKHNIQVDDDILLHPEWSLGEIDAVQKEITQGWIIVGNPGQVVEGLYRLQRETSADELMLTTIEYDGPSRIRTLATIAETCIPHTIA